MLNYFSPSLFARFIFTFLFFLAVESSAQKSKDWNMPYETVANDPMGTRIYTLENGLKIYLSSYKQAPRIQTFIAVKTGSKNDPAQATGLAHYLEHIMFKGTTQFGTMNWDKEKVYLDQIEQLFELHRNTKDTLARKNIYHRIDSLSLIAASFAIANEYSKMLNQMGAEGTNAYTWVDQTVYVNDIPANQIERWAKIEAERFSTVVPRLFHTELEAVYEEKNKGLDNDGRKVWEKMYEGLFPNHPYGTQTTIGTIEHLKNPSITEIKKYFNTYYRANNMAVFMSGDLNYDSTVLILQRYFKQLPAADKPNAPVFTSTAINGPLTTSVVGPTAESVTIGFRIDENLQKDPALQTRLKLLSSMLSNGQAGLLDLNLNQKQKVQGAYSYNINMHDYAILMLGGTPVHGSNTKDCEALLLQEVDNLKKGTFDAALLKAVVTDYKKSLTQELESNKSRAEKLVDTYILDISWASQVDELAYMDKVTAKDISDWATRYFVATQQVTVLKKQGIDSSITKVPKPSISPISVNRDTVSAFDKAVFTIATSDIQPVFLDFKKDVRVLDEQSNLPIVYKQNTENNLFNLYYTWDITREHDLHYNLLIKYLSYLGSSNHKSEELKRAFYAIGCDYKIFSTNDNLYISLSGLDENRAEALTLLEALLNAPLEDLAALENIKQNILKSRKDNKANKDIILKSALKNYGVYGNASPFTNILSAQALNKVSSKQLLALLQHMRNIKHRVLYYGPANADDLKKSILATHQTGTQATPATKIVFTCRKPAKNEVYWVNYDMVQAEIMILNPSAIYNKDLVAESAVFNEYFGGSMSSLVFQEIRESKALAYSVKSNYSIASRKNELNYQVSYIGTQADKMDDAMQAMLSLLNEFPKSETLFNNSITAIKEGIATERIQKMDIISTYEINKRMGIDYDIRKDLYLKLQNYTYQDLLDFHAKYVKGKINTVLVVGSKDKIDFKSLSKYGTVKELSLEEVFGY